MIPKLRSSGELPLEIDATVNVTAAATRNLEAELKQILRDLGLGDRIRIEVSRTRV